ncbi:LuxR C-terminal-related transcriptional regulator [Mesorhizobium sp. CAU 1732]|uniref:LuxR C-terminal-related transcriptional regulator n=1 Tax=Mesorhizobium sp. CAU 1732 TaxID=3140358 RepID=UPI003261C827
MSDRDETSQIIDRIYDVAVDPIRFEEMMDVWDRRLSTYRLGLREDETPIFVDEAIEAHLQRADIFLERLDQTGDEPAELLFAAENKASLIVDATMRIARANPIAESGLGVKSGDRLSRLPLDEHDLNALQSSVRKLLVQREQPPMLLRFTSQTTQRSIVFHLSRQQSSAGETQILVRTTELGWPSHLSSAIRDAFGLTAAEVEVVKALVEGRSVKEIATERDRSFATVRTQISAILAKTETHSQAELIRITLGLMDVIGATVEPPPDSGDEDTVLPIPFQTMKRPDGRRFDFIEFGAKDGWACLYLPMDYGMIRWPRSAELAAEAMGMRVISPVRAGYGHSTPLSANADYRLETARDLLALLDHCGVERCAVIALTADLRHAMQLATLAPDRVAFIMGCSAALPVINAEQYERMHKWHRFVLANARYAPQILPFINKAGFAFAKQIGKERFFRSVNAGSPSDLRTFSIPEIRDAILVGSDVCLSKAHSAHQAFAREVIDGERNWSMLVRECPVPVRLLQGAEDPQTPAETVRELIVEFPHLDIEIVENAGQLLFFQEWPRVLAEVDAMFHGRPIPQPPAP